jgi:general secretion pathway protein I
VTPSAEFGVRSSECRPFGSRCIGVTPHSALGTPHLKGFTLLEVMVAVMILGFVIVSLLGLKNRSMQDVMLAERMTSATLLAKRVMTETLMKGKPVPLEEDGEFEEEEFKEYTWKKIIAPTPLPSVMEVRVAVLWKEGEREEQVELVSYE